MPTPCTVTGTLNQLSGGLIGQGKILFQLTNIGTGNPIGVTGTSIIPQLTYSILTAQNGTFTVSLWGNDNINPVNTLYSVTFFDSLGNSMGPVLYSITGASVNLNTLAAVSTTVPPVFIPFIPGGNFAFTISPQSGTFTASNFATLYMVTTGAGTLTANLPSAVGASGQALIIKKVDTGAGVVVVTPNGAQKIDGLSNFTVSAQWQYLGLVSDNANWQIFTRN